MAKFDRTSPHEPTRAIIDIGSNTVRLVIYGGPIRAPEVLHNEKITARLGKGVAETGMLAERAMAAALSSLARYHTLLRLERIGQVDVVATAAVRDAGNGPEFLRAVQDLGLEPRLLSGEEEAITSAHGVMGAFPGARGVVGDLGGGSLELVDVDAPSCRHGISMPLGSLNLPAMRANGERAFAQRINKAVKKAAWQAAPGSALYLVGGSLRAFARYAIHATDWPIDDPHGFEIAPEEAFKIARGLARKKPDTMLPLVGVANARLASLPDTGALLAILIRTLQPGRLIFSSWGLREGILWQSMPPALQAQDPLVAGATAFAAEYSVSAATAGMVADWIGAAVKMACAAENEQTDHGIRLAAIMLCLASTKVEPNLRGDLARDWALRKRWIGADARARVALAAAMGANTGSLGLSPELTALISPAQLREAHAVGLATRLCRRFSSCTLEGLSGSSLTAERGLLLLCVRPAIAALVNEGVERDLKALAAHLALKAEVRVNVPAEAV
ncbi:exopolyphosphatase [Novosphingobium sp. Chol11]|uniref:Ppx/GppA phosphatase family protein n=1 Tax=Novosphingobium sp. Chol11 TaxID=1385763 RepID=UPI0025EF3415|nr:exopolyphosphatase [Novosphingobium sp. Chol11]